MHSKQSFFTRKSVRSIAVTFGIAITMLHPGIAAAEGLANKILEGPNNSNQRAFTSCTVFYTMCIQRYGSRPGSTAGMTRCGDCLNNCNRSNGWWPRITGCAV
ncbi:hypothetical protein GEM_3481 [Burkholderia cepacia GG4]|uniref:Uncharacterized protein n=1 Tax=Burkholderia cepacia GG4 TaxID=1009846 RepID=A0A9W3K2Q4_BURCE|nr:hypothetical protein GEM_3481 [Burkholderia cepacia GG4]